jgi:hypothetical protein
LFDVDHDHRWFAGTHGRLDRNRVAEPWSLFAVHVAGGGEHDEQSDRDLPQVTHSQMVIYRPAVRIAIFAVVAIACSSPGSNPPTPQPAPEKPAPVVRKRSGCLW